MKARSKEETICEILLLCITLSMASGLTYEEMRAMFRVGEEIAKYVDEAPAGVEATDAMVELASHLLHSELATVSKNKVSPKTQA